MATLLFDGVLHVHYGQAYVLPEGGGGIDLEDSFRGQKSGLCGAAVPGRLFLICGLHTGGVRCRVELHEGRPGELHDWEEVVEVPFAVSGAVILEEWAGQAAYPLALPEGAFRARYAAKEMDAGHEVDTADLGPDSYLLQFWPAAEPAPDAIVRQASQWARYWHGNVLRWPAPG